MNYAPEELTFTYTPRHEIRDPNAPVLPACASAAEIRAYVKTLHGLPEVWINSDDLDSHILGAPGVAVERALLDWDELKERYPEENPWDGRWRIVWTPYNTVRSVVRRLGLGAWNTMYDFGSAFGHFPLYAGMVTEAICKGIELVPERAAHAEAARKRLGLENVSFTCANILDADFSDGDCFYMYYPFSDETFKKVLERLESVARSREAAGLGPITIAAKGACGFNKATWLKYIGGAVTGPHGHIIEVDYYRSIPQFKTH